MALLTDEQMEEILGLCVPHKVIINSGGAAAVMRGFCDLVQYGNNGELIQDDPDLSAVAADDARWMQTIETEGAARWARLSKALAAKYKK